MPELRMPYQKKKYKSDNKKCLQKGMSETTTSESFEGVTRNLP